MKPGLPLTLARNLEAAQSDRGGVDGQMQRANEPRRASLRHLRPGGAPRKGRILRDRKRQPEQFPEAGKKTVRTLA